jgi:hypothetical protein
MMIRFITEKAKKKLTQVKPRHISAAQVGLPEFDCVTIRNWKCVCRPAEAVGLDNEELSMNRRQRGFIGRAPQVGFSPRHFFL